MEKKRKKNFVRHGLSASSPPGDQVPQARAQANHVATTATDRSCHPFFSILIVAGRHKEDTQKREKEQVTRVYNIVADGRAGASNPHPHPMPHTHTQKPSKTLNFALRLMSTDQRMDQRTNGRTKALIELRVLY